MKTPTKKNILGDPSVRRLTKDVIRMSEKSDPIDAYYDVKLALEVLRQRMDRALGK